MPHVIPPPLLPETVALPASLLPCPHPVPQWRSSPKEAALCEGGGGGRPRGDKGSQPTLPFRQKKLPLMALSTTMAESFKELDPDSSMG